MTLLITVFAAIISTVVWLQKDMKNEMKTGTLALIYWGASIMWFVDAIFEYIELGAEYFTPSITEMANDVFLGLSAVALGMIIWLAMVIVRRVKSCI